MNINLTYLGLLSKSLTGSIPSQIGALTKLSYLDLFSNSHTGSIPSQISALTTLTSWDLSSNSLTGSLNATSVADVVAEKLKPFLTASSRDELELYGSATSWPLIGW
jgi:Leucine-rich repeat (LRR) protein